jgi:uncharacterized membrane protein
MLAAMFWVREIKVLAILTLLIIVQLVLILLLAMIDFLFASLRTMTQPNPQRQREMLEEILRQRQETAERDQPSDPVEK